MSAVQKGRVFPLLNFEDDDTTDRKDQFQKSCLDDGYRRVKIKNLLGSVSVNKLIPVR